MTNQLTNPATLKQVIENRRSNRAYSDQVIEPEVIQAISDSLADQNNPFGNTVRYKLISTQAADSAEPMKLGTYGTIKNAKNYMLSATTPDSYRMESLGYQMELAILEAASRGVGTCWLGGTFNRGQFAKAIDLKGDELLPIIIPFGYPAKKDGLIGTMIRSIAGSNQRKPAQELFFEGALFDADLKPLDPAKAGQYAEALEMVRMGPSASNKQPWRIVKDGGKWHFVLAHTKGYSDSFSYDIQRVDMGIAVCHFDLAVKALGLKGQWEMLPEFEGKKRDDQSYIISWIEL